MKPVPELALSVLSALVLMSLVMMAIASRFKPAADLFGLKANQLGLAVELARDQGDFERMVGPPRDGGASAESATRSSLRLQQYADFLYIALYVALFWLLGGAETSAGFPGAALLGAAVRAAIVVAGAFDVMEDAAILRALRGDPSTLSIRTFGLPKWGFFFLAVLLVSVWFLYACLHPLAAAGTGSVERALAGLIGVLFAAGGLLGLAGVARVDGILIGWATAYGIAPAMLALLGLLVALRRGVS